LEAICTPEGVIGDPTKADAKKAIKGVSQTLDYLEKLVNDILEKYPVGQLPPIDKVTMRDPKQLEDIMKGPENGEDIFIRLNIIIILFDGKTHYTF